MLFMAAGVQRVSEAFRILQCSSKGKISKVAQMATPMAGTDSLARPGATTPNSGPLAIVVVKL